MAVTNVCDTRACQQGNIVFFAPHSSHITRTATGLLKRYDYGAFDSMGNFYNGGFDSTGVGRIGLVMNGSSADVDTGYVIALPAGMQVEKSGRLAVIDELTEGILLFPTSSGSNEISVPESICPLAFAFTRGERDLWVADSCAYEAEEYLNSSNPSNPIIAVDANITTAGGIAVVPADIP